MNEIKAYINPHRVRLVREVISICVIFVLALGCAAREMRPGRISTSVDGVELEDSSSAVFESVRVSSEEGRTEISGWIRSRRTRNLNRPGHILLEITSAGGDVLDRREIRYMPTRKPRNPPRKAHFHVLIPFEIPVGGRISIAHHSTPQDH